MKKGILIVTLGLFVIACSAADAVTYSFLKDRGARVYVDTMRWSNNHGLGTGGLKDTLKGSSDKDTTTIIPLDNLEAMSYMLIANGTTNGGTLSCSLDVSLDRTNWKTETGIGIFATATSVTTSIKRLRVLYAGPDSIVGSGVDSVTYSVRGKAKLGSYKWGRFRTIFASGGTATDTVFVTLVTLRSYKPLNTAE